MNTDQTIYYIYHIPGLKIGCTMNLAYRMKQQNNPKYEILEEHTDLKTASRREIELQIEYFGKKDTGQSYEERVTKAKRKAVVQYTKEGVKVAEYNSIKEAKLAVGVNGIGEVCRGEHKTAGGFIWKLKE